jgi:hypothetical protein
MKVYNKDKTEILKEYDLKLGYLIQDTIIKHIDKIEAVEEQGHYEIIKEYANGGKDMKWVIDVEEVEAIEEKDIEEDIQVYIPYTEEEILKLNNKKRIQEQKEFLDETDYIIIKMSEEFVQGGSIIKMLSEYKEVLSKRKEARTLINELEKEQ